MHCTTQAGDGMGGFLWQSASPLLAGTGPGACHWLGVWKGSGEVEREEGRGVGRERGFGRRETRGVEAWSAAGNEVFSFHPQKAECERTGPGSAQLHRFFCL